MYTCMPQLEFKLADRTASSNSNAKLLIGSQSWHVLLYASRAQGMTDPKLTHASYPET